MLSQVRYSLPEVNLNAVLSPRAGEKMVLTTNWRYSRVFLLDEGRGLRIRLGEMVFGLVQLTSGRRRAGRVWKEDFLPNSTAMEDKKSPKFPSNSRLPVNEEKKEENRGRKVFGEISCRIKRRCVIRTIALIACKSS